MTQVGSFQLEVANIWLNLINIIEKHGKETLQQAGTNDY
jgi:hypothetical protein